MDYKNKNEILKCMHEWKSTQLIYSTVTDCIKCHVKKEDWDNPTFTSDLTKKHNGDAFSKIMYEELSGDKYSEDEYTDWF